MLEITLELEESMSDDDIDSKMKEEFPGIVYYTKFRRGKKFIVLEIEENES